MSIGRNIWRAAAGLLWMPCAAVLAQTTPGDAPQKSFTDRFNIHPSYSTRYQVARTSRTWNQEGKLDRNVWIGRSPSDSLAPDQAPPKPLFFSSRIKMKIKEDERLNDLQEEVGELALLMNKAFGRFELKSDNLFKRQWKETTRSGRTFNEDQVRLGGLLDIIKDETRTLNLSLWGKWVKKKDVNEQYRANVDLVDETISSGLGGDLDLNGSWMPSEDFTFTTTTSYESQTRESESLSLEIEPDTTYTDLITNTDRDHSLSSRADVEWERFEAFKVAISTTYTDMSNQYYLVNQRTQETMTTSKLMNDLVVQGQLGESFRYGLSALSSDSETDYDLQSKGGTDQRTDYAVDGRYEFTQRYLNGTIIKGSYATGTLHKEVPQTNTIYDTDTKGAEGNISRGFGEAILQGRPKPRVRISASTSVSLRQDFHEDGLRDEDRLIVQNTYNVRYTPSDRLDSRISYTSRTDKVLKIAKESSINSQETEDYTLQLRYEAELPAGIMIRQIYQLGATYVYKIFDEDANTLTRLNQVTTGLSTTFWQRTRLTLDHMMKKSDSGAYVYASNGKDRNYIKGSRSLRQKLEVGSRFDVTDVIYVLAGETIDVSSRQTLSTGARSETEKYTFRGEAGIEKKFKSGLNVRASFARTSSTKEDDYWNISANAEMKF